MPNNPKGENATSGGGKKKADSQVCCQGLTNCNYSRAKVADIEAEADISEEMS
jgi:hypothetical protein